jgi:hypothetical protein
VPHRPTNSYPKREDEMATVEGLNLRGSRYYWSLELELTRFGGRFLV